MNLRRLALILVLMTLTYCCVTCRKAGMIQHSGIDDGTEIYNTEELMRSARRRRPSIVMRNNRARFGRWRNNVANRDRINVGTRSEEEFLNNHYGYVGAIASGEESEYVNDRSRYQNRPNQFAEEGPYQKTERRQYQYIEKKPYQYTDVTRNYAAGPNNYMPQYGSEETVYGDSQGRQYFESQKTNIPEASNSQGHYNSVIEHGADPEACSGKKNGIHEGGPCEQWYLSCRNGKARKIFCENELYWNGDENRCEPKDNIYYCRLRFNCSGLDDGVYVDGCTNVFWFCAGETASLSKCPKGLYFNAKRTRCDVRKKIPACGGSTEKTGKRFVKKKGRKSKDQKKSVRSKKWKIAYSVTEPFQMHHVCAERKDGEYAIGQCYEKYLQCIGGKGLIVQCASGQVFSQKYNQCLNPRKLPTCASIQEAKATAVTETDNFSPNIVGAPFEYSNPCASLKDGIYQLGDCERNFLICANGIGNNASCSTGLAFNGQTGQCDYMYNIEKCPQDEAQNLHDSVAAAFHDKDCRCKGQKDGLYSFGCTEKFYSCSNGISTGFECPADMVFNIDGGFCDHPQNVAACGGHPAFAQITFNDDEKHEMHSGCSILDDGIYGLSPCGSGYYHCWRGATSFAKCAFGLVFNPSLGRCDFRKNVEGCPQYNRTSAEAAKEMHGFLFTSEKGQNTKCRSMDDGFYSDGCSEIYYGCANGDTFYMKCPSGLKFNAHSGTCEIPQNIEDCKDISADLTMQPFSETISLSSCTVLPNGPHQLDLCLQDYILCYDGAIYLASCPGQLVFNPENSECDFRINLQACQRTDESPSGTPDSRCANRADGIFSDICSRNFHICARGKIYQFACPHQMIFNSEFGRCEDAAGVQNCHQSIVTQTPTVSVLADSRAPLQKSANGIIAVSPHIEDSSNVQDCDGSRNGNYAVGPCSKAFFACVGTTKIAMSCPETLVFDARFNRCEEKRNVPQCASMEVSPVDIPYVETAVKDIEKQFDSTNANYLDKSICAERMDGIFPLDSCLKTYLRCINQRGLLENCPDDMLFDERIRACTPKESCSQLVSSEMLFVANENSYTISDSMPIFSTVLPQHLINNRTMSAISDRKDVELSSSSSCRELPDGDYSVGCVANFITCTGGAEINNKCMEPMTFSNVLRRCVPYEECVFLMYRVLASPQTTTSSLCKTDGSQACTKDIDSTTRKIEQSGLNCWSLPDGDYSVGCSNIYVTCVSGVPVVRNCPSDQVYDQNSKSCATRTRCTEMPLRSTTQISIIRQRISLDISDGLDCNVLDDGLYSLGLCVDKFVHCVNKISFVMDCPAGLVFDADAKRCEYAKAQCAYRTQSAGMNEEPQGADAHTEGEDRSHFCVPRVSHNRADSVNCDVLDDGIYAFLCSNKIVICDRGQKMIRRCPTGRVFIPELRRCSKLSDCKIIPRCDEDSVDVFYVARFEIADQLPKILTTAPESDFDQFSCINQPDGNYGEQCSTVYISCLRGAANIQACKSGQLFDQHSGQCIASELCKISSSIPDTDTMNCVEHARYGIGFCNDYYYTCKNGKFIITQCPLGETFDAASGICRNKCDLCGCDEERTSTSICYPGEITARGSCLDNYLQCSEKGSLEVKRCLKDERFDSQLLKCRPYDEIAECFSVDEEEKPGISGLHPPPQPQFHVDDAFHPPKRLFPGLQSIFTSPQDLRLAAQTAYQLLSQPEDANIFHSEFPYDSAPMISNYGKKPITILYGNEHSNAPLSSIFIPRTAPAQPILSAFGNPVDPVQAVQDTFKAVAAPYGRTPFGTNDMLDVNVIDEFRPPNKPPYPLPYYPIPTSSYTYLPEPLVALAPEFVKNDTADDIEGSGEDGESSTVSNTTRRTKRHTVWYSSNEIEEFCYTKTHPVNVAIGFCQKNYIFCEGKGNHGYERSCTDGELFDDRLGSCVPASECKRKKVFRRSMINETASVLFDCSHREDGAYALGCSSKFAYCSAGQKHTFVCQEGLIFDGTAQQCRPLDHVHACNSAAYTDAPKTSPCANLPDGIYALPGCSRHFLSCLSKKALLRSCPHGFYYDESKRQCDSKEHVRACNTTAAYMTHVTLAKEKLGVAETDAVHQVPSVIPNFACSVDSSISLGCSPDFIVCASGIAYIFHCDQGLVFDQTRSSCNKVEFTRECRSTAPKRTSMTTGFIFSAPSARSGGSPHSSEDLMNVTSGISSFDCTNALDGVHAFQCSPLFFVCSAGRITGFVCQDALIFNPETGFCDHKEYVSSCGGARLIKSPSILSPVLDKTTTKSSFITTQPSYHSTAQRREACKAQFSGVLSTGCSSKFILCAHGVGHLFTCQQGLIYDIETNRCDYHENVAACTGQATYAERAYGASHFENASISSIRIVDLRSVTPSGDVMKARCSASSSETTSYGRCRMDYITCPENGPAHQSYCISGYLFDEDIGRCVPAEVCGTISDAVAESASLAKGMCDGIEDGIAKGIGPCLNHYYVCMKGDPIRRRCFKHLETFSSAAAACVPRSHNPECLHQPVILTNGIKRAEGADDFCRDRPDGMYRHPEVCTRILQCFGKELFEHLPCSDGLVFNEISGGCDYRSNVPGCAVETSLKQDKFRKTNSECQGKSHGEFIVDEEDCSVYYRCIWGKLEKIFCPEHTVFNPILSVCDYPSEVPYCKIIS